jgi:large subunit ribosomal protein L24
MAKIKKGDTVIVLSGGDKGTKGEVLRVFPKESRLTVKGVNIVTKHRKANRMQGGKLEHMEAPIHLSNVAIADPKTGKPSRVGFKILEDGRKLRIAKRSGEAIDA